MPHKHGQEPLKNHVTQLLSCQICPRMQRPSVSGGAVMSKVLLVGQAPGAKEPELKRPFAWTAGKTLFRWFEASCGISETAFRQNIYMAAVCRCFPGKNPKGGDRVPNATEISNCSRWMRREFHILQPELVIPVGKLAIRQFLEFQRLTEVIGQSKQHEFAGVNADFIPLPHPSGASTWHRTQPGKSLTAEALKLIAEHPAFKRILARNH